VVVEVGTELTEELWATSDATVFSSILSVPECQAAVARAERSGRITTGAMDESLTLLDAVLREIEFVEVDLGIAEVAGALAVEFGLRGYDSVHLAAALNLRTIDPLFVAWDVDLNQAASQTGLRTLAT
jgi:hypothetical protein